MPLQPAVKNEVIRKLEAYEGRVNHLYLCSTGHVTVGVGHMIANRAAVAAVVMYQVRGSLPTQLATLAEKQTEFDRIAGQPRGYRAEWYRQHTRLVMRDADMDAQRDRHVDSFYRELVGIYRRSRGYVDDFDKLPRPVQIALFDMIFNLGAYRIVHVFRRFDAAIRAGDWVTAAAESNRPQVNAERNRFVRALFLSAAREAA